MYPPLRTRLLVAMHDDIENTSIVGDDAEEISYKLKQLADYKNARKGTESS